jgi:hypothetical protein
MVVAAVLVAAVLHAGWNAIAKGVPDRLGLFARMSVVDVAIGAALLIFVPQPAAAAVPWMLRARQARPVDPRDRLPQGDRPPPWGGQAAGSDRGRARPGGPR